LNGIIRDTKKLPKAFVSSPAFSQFWYSGRRACTEFDNGTAASYCSHFAPQLKIVAKNFSFNLVAVSFQQAAYIRWL
jgi:hypothetical protein